MTGISPVNRLNGASGEFGGAWGYRGVRLLLNTITNVTQTKNMTRRKNSKFDNIQYL